MKSESVDPIVSRFCLAILDGEKDAILLLADRLQALGHPNANRVRELHNNLYFSARDESVAVLLALPDSICWLLACDFADHWMKEIHADTSPNSKHSQIVQLCRGRAAGQISEKQLAKLLEAHHIIIRHGQKQETGMRPHAMPYAESWHSPPLEVGNRHGSTVVSGNICSPMRRVNKVGSIGRGPSGRKLVSVRFTQ